MTAIYGGDKITFPDSSVQASAQVGMKNRIIDGAFILNQRGYVTSTSLSSGTYGHDRWKGGASAGTYTFTQGALGVPTTITITAGSIIQVIEGCNLPEGDTYVLSWTGTAQGRLNGGSYGASGSVTVTGWVAGTNLNVEFNTGTLGSVQLEKGSTATSFDYRPFGTELALCQRYYVGANGDYFFTAGYDASYTTINTGGLAWSYQMRTTPTIVIVSGGMDGHHPVAPTVRNGPAYYGVGLMFSGGGLRTNSNCSAYVSFSLSAEL